MLDITPNFAEERPGAVRALREVQGIPTAFEVLVGDGYVRFWGPGITAQQAQPFTAREIADAVLLYFGPPSCDCPEIGDWDQIH
jgi:hypothetical protein